MKVKKIDKEKIECIIEKSEMEKFNVTISDFKNYPNLTNKNAIKLINSVVDETCKIWSKTDGRVGMYKISVELRETTTKEIYAILKKIEEINIEDYDDYIEDNDDYEEYDEYLNNCHDDFIEYCEPTPGQIFATYDLSILINFSNILINRGYKNSDLFKSSIGEYCLYLKGNFDEDILWKITNLATDEFNLMYYPLDLTEAVYATATEHHSILIKDKAIEALSS